MDAAQSLPKTRLQAAQEGETFFYTGKPCRHGHVSKRYTSSGACFECMELKAKELREMRQLGKQKKSRQQVIAIAQ